MPLLYKDPKEYALNTRTKRIFKLFQVGLVGNK